MSRSLSIVFVSFFTLLTAYGQTPAAGTTLKSLPLEAAVPIDSVDSTITPSIPATLLSSLTSGTMDLRQQLTYTAAAQTLTITGISEAAGSPLPTPADAAGVTRLWTYPINVDRVDLTAKPGNAVVFLGSVASVGKCVARRACLSQLLVSEAQVKPCRGVGAI